MFFIIAIIKNSLSCKLVTLIYLWRCGQDCDSIEALFTRFNAHLKGLGYLAMGGQIMDASIISAPCQRMTDEERTIVRGGGIPEAWAAKPARLAQMDACLPVIVVEIRTEFGIS